LYREDNPELWARVEAMSPAELVRIQRETVERLRQLMEEVRLRAAVASYVYLFLFDAATDEYGDPSHADDDVCWKADPIDEATFNTWVAIDDGAFDVCSEADWQEIERRLADPSIRRWVDYVRSDLGKVESARRPAEANQREEVEA
jgi:hypothetical protein